jgi:F-type H+-transporting ATPase subunit gamma
MGDGRALADRLFRMMLYHMQLEANASEHSARMVAMKTASENAEEIVDDLTLIYNKGRQAKITQEIVEITGGAEAVS